MTFHEQITNDALTLYDKDILPKEKLEFIQRELLATDAKYDSLLTRYQELKQQVKTSRPQWHDLRKDPNDLPKPSVLYWDVTERVLASHKIAQNQYITNILRYSYVDKCWKSPESILYEDVIAWCEIPTFDKE